MDLSGLITTLLVIVFLGLIYWFTTKNDSYWEKQRIPYIKSLPVVGSMKDVILMKRSFVDILQEMYIKFNRKKVVGYFNFLTPTVMVCDPELINQVLIKDFIHFEDRMPPIMNSEDLFGKSLGSLSGDEWRTARHKLTPTFTSGKLKMMFGSIKECSEEGVDDIDKKIGDDIEAREFMLKIVFNIIANIAFGLKVNTLNLNDEQSNQFYKYASKFFESSSPKLMKMLFFFFFPKLRGLLKIKLMSNDVDSFFRNLTRDILNYREKTNTKKNDFLNLMMDLRKKEQENLQNNGLSCTKTKTHETEQVDLEDKELMDQLKNTPIGGSSDSRMSEIFTEEFIASQSFLFITAGSESTASALSFVLYELAVNKNVQERVHDEIINVLSSQQFNYQAVQKMTYLEQCINETLRIHPALPALARVCNSDYKIPGTDYIIEKGMSITIPVYGLHMDSQYFPDPEKYNPDHFQDMDIVPKGVFFPFGSGPRMCIAMRLAMLEMKVILATLLQKYIVVLSEKTKLPLKPAMDGLTPRVVGGMWVKFQKREV